MGKQQIKKNRRINNEVILTLIVSMITVSFLLILAFVKVNTNVKEYSRMRTPGVEAPTVLDIAQDPELITCADKEKEGVTLTQRQILLQKSGLEPDESIVNWALAEGISSYVEYSIGANASNFAGYDFNEVQQVMVKRILNQLNSSEFHNDFYRLVIQDTGYHGWKYVSVNPPRVRETTLINVLKVLGNKPDYEIPENVYYQASFLYSGNDENVTKIGNKVIVSNAYQAFDLLCEKGLSDTLYPYASYTYIDPYGNPRLLIFCGSYDDL